MSLSNFHLTGRKVIGAIFNYKAGLDPITPKPDTPLLFLKAPSSLITEGQSIEVLPEFTLNEEVELGVVIGKKGKNISLADALSYVGGYCLALDMSDMVMLGKLRKEGLPWTFSKGFDTACPISRFVCHEELLDPDNVQLWCKINDKVVQDANTNDLLFPVPALISYISKYMTLEPGDLILTGCPPGSTRVAPGDVIEAGLGDILTMKFPVKAAP